MPHTTTIQDIDQLQLELMSFVKVGSNISPYAGWLCLSRVVFVPALVILTASLGHGQSVAPVTQLDPVSLRERDKLLREATEAKQTGKLELVADFLRQAYELEERVLGRTHERLLQTLDWRAEIAAERRRWDDAIALRKQALTLGQKLYPQADFRVRDLNLSLEDAQRKAILTDQQLDEIAQATAQMNQVNQFQQSQQYLVASKLAEQVVATRERLLTKEHPAHIESLAILGQCYRDMGNHEFAEKTLQRAQNLFRDTLGEQHPSYAQCVNDLAVLYGLKKEYQRAERLHVIAKDIRKKTLGADHIDYVDSLDDLATLHLATGDRKKALKMLTEVKSVLENIMPEDHPFHATALCRLASVHFQNREFKLAEPLLRKAKRFRAKALGEDHAEYGKTLVWLVQLYLESGDLAKAEPLLHELKAIQERRVGKRHADYLTVVIALADFYLKMEDLERAEKTVLEARQLVEAHLGRDHAHYPSVLNLLGETYRAKGDYRRAEPMLEDALDNCSRIVGEENLQYAQIAFNLGNLKILLGEYSAAETLQHKAAEIRKKIHGPRSLEYAFVLNSLAVLQSDCGHYVEAKKLHLQAQEIRLSQLGDQHPVYAETLHNLAVLYTRMGDIEGARPLFIACKEVFEQSRGTHSHYYVSTLYSLAISYALTRDLDRSEHYATKVAQLRKETLGEDSPDYAASLIMLAFLNTQKRRFDESEKLIEKAKTITENTLQPGHPYHCTVLNHQAALHVHRGDFLNAAKTLEQQKRLVESVFGSDHRSYEDALNGLATVHMLRDEPKAAATSAEEALIATKRRLDTTAVSLSEHQQLAMGWSVRYHLDLFLTATRQSSQSDPQVFQHVLDWKGATLARQRELRQLRNVPGIEETFQQLQRIMMLRASLFRAGPKDDQADSWKSQLAELRDQQQALESDLSEQRAKIGGASKRVKVDDLVASLPANAVLVDFLEYARSTKEELKLGNAGSVLSLVAFIIRPNGDVKRLELGPTGDLTAAIDQWRSSRGVSAGATKAGHYLRQRLWEPLLPHVQDARTIILSPYGAMGRLPFAALPGKEDGTFLLEDHRVALVPVPRLMPDLVNRPMESGHERSLLLLGDVDYDQSDNDASKLPTKENGLDGNTVGKRLHFDAIEATRREVDAIEKLHLRAVPREAPNIARLLGRRATETRFRELAPRCRVLHLATHGFFAPADQRSALQMHSENQMPRMSWLPDASEPIRGLSPGLLSGLVFAGANLPPRPGRDDGILTADEISAMQLDGVELAVLSACETGLGEVAGGEGLLGIQRAFQVAGVRATVASLWQVPDEATRILMERFYANLMKPTSNGRHPSRLDALLEAQRWMLNHPDELKAAGAFRGVGRVRSQTIVTSKRTPPEFWAAFTLSGEWE